MNAGGQRAPMPLEVAQTGTGRSRAEMWGVVLVLVLAGLSVFVLAVILDGVDVRGAGVFARAGYCSVSGNTTGAGSSLQPGTFLDLVVGEPATNGHYTGATPANFVKGIGLTCADPPAGYVSNGFASGAGQAGSGVYPYYVPAGS
jgi:hypothetical protein